MIEYDVFFSIYNLLYLLLALYVILSSFKLDKKGELSSNHKINSSFTFFFISFVLIFGLRSFEVGVDTLNYYNYYWINDLNIEISTEFLFLYLMSFIQDINFSFSFFLLIISFGYLFYFSRSFKYFSHLFKVPVIFIFFIFIYLFFSLSMGINIIRQGVSLAILLYAVTLFLNKSRFISYILYFIIALLTHSTSIIPLAIFLVIYKFGYNIRLKYFYALFFIGILLSYMNFGILNVAPFLQQMLDNNRRVSYLTNESDVYQIGFKTQFVVFNIFFLLLSQIIYSRLLKIKFNDEIYNVFLKYYIVSSFLFFMTFQIPYSDRWGLLSWFIIPVLMTPLYSSRFKTLPKTIFTIIFFLIFIFFNIYE